MKTFVLEGTGRRGRGHRTDSGRLSSWGITAALPSIVVIVATAVIIVIIPIDFGNLCG